MTVGDVTITTLDVIGLDGTRTSGGTNNVTNIGAPGGLGINSAVADTAKNFEAGEGWEFKFNTDVYLQSIDLLEMVAGGTLSVDRVVAMTCTRGHPVDIAALPDHLDRSRPAVVAEAIEAALREGGIKTDCSDLFSHIKIDLPTAQLAAASAVLVDLHLI